MSEGTNSSSEDAMGPHARRRRPQVGGGPLGAEVLGALQLCSVCSTHLQLRREPGRKGVQASRKQQSAARTAAPGRWHKRDGGGSLWHAAAALLALASQSRSRPPAAVTLGAPQEQTAGAASCQHEQAATGRPLVQRCRNLMHSRGTRQHEQVA